jgi:HD-GYP domain-containing protein (c-di-GMP phosphodiesterase class II)
LARPVSIPEHRPGAEKSFSKTLAQRSFERGESLLGRDVAAEADPAAGRGAEEGMMSLACAVLRSPRQRLGVLHLDRGPGQEPFTEAELELADSIAAGRPAPRVPAVGIESTLHAERQREMFLQTVAALAQAVETRDCNTGGHTQRVTAYSLLLADELGLSASERYWLRLGHPRFVGRCRCTTSARSASPTACSASRGN